MTLFHYTTLSGFKSIIESQSLWCSNVRYLNDEKEALVAKEKFAASLDTAIDEVPKSIHIDRARRAVSIAKNTPVTSFATCFCREGDLLSQWRGYSSSERGICIGFSEAGLRSVSNEYNGDIENVLYGDEITSHLLDLFIKFLREPNNLKPDQKEYQFDRLLEALLKVCSISKDRGFSEEKEVRIVVAENARKRKKALYRAGQNFLIPYDALNFQKSVIERVIIGPGTNPSLTAFSVTEFLEMHEIKRSVVENSSVPYRA